MLDLKKVREKINSSRATLETDFSVTKIGIFGSVAKGLATENSDVDILVEFSKPVGLFLFGSLSVFLENLLGSKVDLATKKGLKPFVRDEILSHTVYL